MTRFGPSPRKGTLSLVTASTSSAVLLACAMPGRIGWWPLLFIALIPLLAFIADNRPGRSFTAGFLTGFLYHVALLYWIVIVLGRYGGLPVWLATLTMLLLSAYMGLYLGVFSAIVSKASGRAKENGLSVIMLIAPVLWVGLDWLRGRALTGFPWMDMGYGLYSRPILIQAADLGGHHLVTFFLVLVNVLVLYLLHRGSRTIRQPDPRGKRVALAACLVLTLLSVYSVGRYRQLERIIDTGKRVTVAVVQGNIPQDEKWIPVGKESTLDIYRNLTGRGLQDNHAELVVWPETALPFYPVNDPLFLSVTGFARDRDIWLLTGAPYFTVNTLSPVTDSVLRYFNSALLISPQGRVTARYDKQHLVPFGEYVPLSRYLPFLEPLVVHVGNFTPGSSSDPLQLGRIKAGVLICFESIFADLARKQAKSGANLLVNLTNDAWYGRSSAPYQSFAMSVFRSAETRRSLVRAANTGISGFVDPLGRIVQESPLFEPAVLTAMVPLIEEKSVFTGFGFLFGPGCLVLAPFLFFPLGKKRQVY